MRILVRDENSKNWDYADSLSTKTEAELQQLVIESPTLIPIGDIRDNMTPLVLAVREFGLPGSGNTDALAFTAEGDVAVLECKLATNPEIKRKVIGQIIEYAAFLWEMTYEEVDRRVQSRLGKPLVDIMREAVAGERACEILSEHGEAVGIPGLEETEKRSLQRNTTISSRRMNVKTLYLLPLIWVLLASSIAHAQQDFRCGSATTGTYIVKTGESKADVLMKCGEPMMREDAGSDATGRFGTSTTYRGSESRTRGAYQESVKRVELWYYNLGEGQFNRILEFHGSTLAFIHVSDQRGKGLPDWERNR